MPTILDRFKRSWNAFIGRDPTYIKELYDDNVVIGYGNSYRPDRVRFTRTSSTTIVSAVYNRIAVDVSQFNVRHVMLDEQGRFTKEVDSYLNECLSIEANIDQTGKAFIQDVVQSMFDEGSVAIVPTDCDVNELRTRVNEAKVYSLRTGKILEWYPLHVKVNVYNDRTGKREDIMIPKSLCAIVENPFYSIMNEPNSTLQRLLRAIAQLNAYNDDNASDKLNMIIQLPYVVRSDLRKAEANRRLSEMEEQLNNSKYGIAYADGTERIIQLNRAIENNLWQQVKELEEQLYKQLGMTPGIFDGTANEATINNYISHTVIPILSAITEAIERVFLTKTARSQGQSIMYFVDPLKNVAASQLADMAYKLITGQIMTSNEIRTKIGLAPFDDPGADKLQNPNLNQSNAQIEQEAADEMPPEGELQSTESTGRDLNSLSFEEFEKSIPNIIGDSRNE